MELFERGKYYMAITVLILLAAFATLWWRTQNRTGTFPRQLPWRQPTSSLAISAQSGTGAPTMMIILNAPNLEWLNGVALRLLTNLPPEAIVNLQPGPELTAAGFTVPVSQVLTDPTNQTGVVEIAGISFPKKELGLRAPLVLATFQVNPVGEGRTAEFEFDPAATKVTFWDLKTPKLVLNKKEATF